MIYGRVAPKKDEEYRRWVRERDCLLELADWRHSCTGDVQAHHVRARRRFGDWLEKGQGNLVPLCHGAHRELHDTGRGTVAARWGLDLERAAYGLGCRFLWEERLEYTGEAGAAGDQE